MICIVAERGTVKLKSVAKIMCAHYMDFLKINHLECVLLRQGHHRHAEGLPYFRRMVSTIGCAGPVEGMTLLK